MNVIIIHYHTVLYYSIIVGVSLLKELLLHHVKREEVILQKLQATYNYYAYKLIVATCLPDK